MVVGEKTGHFSWSVSARPRLSPCCGSGFVQGLLGQRWPGPPHGRLHETKSLLSPGRMSVHVIIVLRCQLQRGQEKTVNPFTSRSLEAELTGGRGQEGFQPIKTNRAWYSPNRPAIWLPNGKKCLLMTLASGEGREGGLSEEFPGRGPRILVSLSVLGGAARIRTVCGTRESNLNRAISYVCETASSSHMVHNMRPCLSFTVTLRWEKDRVQRLVYKSL